MRSNTAMTHPDPTQERLTDLEIKTSFTEDMLDEINQTLYRQQQQIDQLTRELLLLRQQSAEAADPVRGARDDLPPHY